MTDGSFWVRGLLSPSTVDELQRALDVAPFADGRATAHGGARAVKRNLQLDSADSVARRQGRLLVDALDASEPFKGAAFPRMILPFKFARYEAGDAYGDHLDLPVVGAGAGLLRTDLSMTVFLASPAAYEGGDLVLLGDGDPVRIRGEAGDAFVYPSGTLHRVDPVTAGRRLVAITWIQSLIPDDADRATLAMLTATMVALAESGAEAASLLRLRQVQHRLLRRWAR